MSDDELLDEQLRYYGQRATFYDDAYTRTGHSDRGPEANERWWRELRVVEDALDRAPIHGDVLELGCGTGHWTRRLAAQATSVTALDGSAEMLEVARARLAGADNVSFDHVDLLREWAPTRTYDAIAAFFFLEHVPDTHIDSLTAKIRAALRPGGCVFVAEGKQREELPHVELRHLHDHEFRVVERRRGPDDFTALFAAHGITARVTTTDHLFCIVEGRASD